MSDEINTHYLARGFAVADEVVLSEGKTTRVVFRPALHDDKGVRGEIFRQKVGADGAWADTNDVDFRKLPPDCGTSIELRTDAMRKLFSKLNQLYSIHGQGIARHDQRYVVAREEDVVLVDDETRAKAIKDLLAKGHSEEVWKALVASDPDLSTRLAAAQIQIDRQAAIRTFAAALPEHRDEEKPWQAFFQKHPWMLQSAFSAAVFMLAGETYVGGKQPVGRQGRGGVATDFLFSDESTKSFAVVEIKTPGTNLVGGVYRGERESGEEQETYSISADLSGSVVQTRNQIAVAIEHFGSVLAKGFGGKLNRAHPKGVLVVGDYQILSEREQASFNQFRHGLYSLTVITFDELLRRLCIMYDVDVT